MFSMTKVVISLSTSLLIFLAIELMGMVKDVTAFRERFNAYKNGKSVSEIYDAGLPRYGDGLAPTTTYSDDDALSYIIALENPNKVGWDSNKKVWRVPTAKGFDHNAIAYGLDIREKHNPYVYNFLKSKGRLNDPWLTDSEARSLAMKSYHSKDNSVAKAMGIAKGKVSDRGYLVLRGMAWHGDPMKKLLDEDTVTGKAFRRAIAEGDADLDTVFDAYYLHPANAKKYAERIKADAKYRPLALFVTLDGKVLKIDWNKQVPKWLPPQLQMPHNTEYPIGNTAPESISSWSGADSPSKGPRILSVLDTMQLQQNILNLFGLHPVTSRRSILPPLSKLMPSLDELMAEQQTDYIKDILDIENPIKDTLYHAKNGKLPGYKDGTGNSLNMGERSQLTSDEIANLVLNAPHEQGLQNGPIEDAVAAYIGGKTVSMINAYNNYRRLRNAKNTYRIYREANDNTKNAAGTGPAPRSWKIADADHYARIMLEGDTPLGFLYDTFVSPISSLYTKMQRHPSIGPVMRLFE